MSLFEFAADRRRVLRRLLGSTAAGLATLAGGRLFDPDAAHARGISSSTPEAVTPDKDSMTLFVQIARSGSMVPIGADRYSITLEDVAPVTIHFTDRPNREVGATLNAAFLRGLGFPEGNPPNAALVASTAEGTEIVVVELFDPQYDEPARRLRYTAALLTNEDDSTPAVFGSSRVPASFDHASLLIDDCSSALVQCFDANGNLLSGEDPVEMALCWRADKTNCALCGNAQPPELYGDFTCDYTADWCRDNGWPTTASATFSSDNFTPSGCPPRPPV